MRDGVFGAQVIELFDALANARADGPWLAVASFVNPHDIAFNGFGWNTLLQFPLPDDSVPAVAEAPSQSDSFAGRPPCQEQFVAVWPQMLYEQDTDLAYRRLYYFLHKAVDVVIARVLEALEASGMADDTIVVFTSDHGDVLGAHGGMMQKWYNAYDEAIRVPLVVKGPGVAVAPGGVTMPTSHIDLVPTLMGLAGIDVERAAAGVAEHHEEAQPLPGRDLSALIAGGAPAESHAAPLYFMTDDDVSRGLNQYALFSGTPFDAVAMPSRVESVIATLPTGEGGADELWKLNHYYERLDEWNEAHGITPPPFSAPAAESMFELHNLTVDPEERTNRAGTDVATRSRLQTVLESEREEKRRLPSHRNPR